MLKEPLKKGKSLTFKAWSMTKVKSWLNLPCFITHRTGSFVLNARLSSAESVRLLLTIKDSIVTSTKTINLLWRADTVKRSSISRIISRRLFTIFVTSLIASKEWAWPVTKYWSAGILAVGSKARKSACHAYLKNARKEKKSDWKARLAMTIASAAIQRHWELLHASRRNVVISFIMNASPRRLISNGGQQGSSSNGACVRFVSNG